MTRAGRLLAAAAAIAGACIASAPAPAGAHPEMSPLLTNRYLTVTALPGRLAFSYALLLGPLPGGEYRRKLDRNGDGQVDAAELDGERARLLARAATLFTFTVDGVAPRIDLRPVVDLGRDASAGALPVVLELGAMIDLGPGVHRIRLEPGEDPERLGETELAIDVTPAWKLEASHQGARPAGDSDAVAGTRFRFEGPRRTAIEDRSATFVIAAGGSEAAGGPGAGGAGGAASALGKPPSPAGPQDADRPLQAPGSTIFVAIAAIVGLGLGAALVLWRRRKL